MLTIIPLVEQLYKPLGIVKLLALQTLLQVNSKLFGLYANAVCVAPVNAMLSFVYTILMHDIQSAIETVGLDPFVGFLHKDRPGRPSLALDMMEEFRPYLADRLVLSLINRKQVNPKGFQKKESGGVLMTEDTRKEVITAWQKRKQQTIVHPWLQEEISIGLLPYVQALLFARHLRGDLDNYPVFVMK